MNMEQRRNLLKSINTVKSFSNSSDWLSTFHVSTIDNSGSINEKLDKILNETTTTSTSDLQINLQNDYPIPYTFRVPSPAINTRTRHAKCPPFYMQLDHTIAVLWHVFGKREKRQKMKIGIGQLQWALYFLKGIKDPLEGTRQADIDVAIKAIEDCLIECYADMAHFIMRNPQIKDEASLYTKNTTESSPKPTTNIGTSSSLGMMVKPRQSVSHVDDFHIFSTVSYTTMEPTNTNIEVSTTLEELIKFRNASVQEPVTTTNNFTESAKETDDIYAELKKLREEQIRKLNAEIKHLRELEDATNIKDAEWLSLNADQMNHLTISNASK